MATPRAITRSDGRVQTFNTKNDLKPDVREQMISLLNQQLADTFDLFSQTKQAHWNVKGREFYQLHELFDELADELREFVDLIAERATALGGLATGTARMAASATRLPELPLEVVDSMQMVEALAERYANVAATTRTGIETAEKVGDMLTSDMLTEISRGLDKSLWFLEAHIQAGK